jgi:predicted Fe-Mo cluster-binding NifX family protein
MKIAFAANGNSPESKLDHCLGKCSYFLIYNTENAAIEFIQNPMNYILINAGKSAVKILHGHHTNIIIARNFGVKAIIEAKRKNIGTQVIDDDMTCISTLIDTYNKF